TSFASVSATDLVIVPSADPVQQISSLISSTLITNLTANIQNQLDGKLAAALATLDAAGNHAVQTAANQLQAFINAVSADLQGHKLTCAQAVPLVNAAQGIIAALGQSPASVNLACQ